MRDELRIRLCKSSLLRDLVRLSAGLGILNVGVSVYSGDWRLIFAALGSALLWATLLQMNPVGVTLVCKSIREASGAWQCKAGDDSDFLPCQLQARGRFAGVVWLNCVFDSSASEVGTLHKTLLIFHDAMSDEQWRLFRRQLRLISHAVET